MRPLLAENVQAATQQLDLVLELDEPSFLASDFTREIGLYRLGHGYFYRKRGARRTVGQPSHGLRLRRL